MKPWNRAAQALESGVEAVGLGNAMRSASSALGLAPTTGAAEQQQRNMLARSPYRSSEAGKFVGNIVGTLPTAVLPGGALVQSAVAGALLGDETTPGGIARDALIGGLTGKAGEVGMRAVSRAISPRVAPVISRLQARGIPVTPGQIMGAANTSAGRAIKATEEKATSIPIVGDVINAARRRGVEGFNRAALNEPLASIGESLPKSMEIGHEAVRHIDETLGRAYDDVLPKLSGQADDQFAKDLTDIAGLADTMTPDRATQFGKIMKADVQRFFGEDGSIGGEGFKEIESRLGARIRKFGSSVEPDAQDMAEALRGAQAAVRDMAARQNPTEAARLSQINEGWAKLTRIERAAANALKGEFTPGQLRTATRAGDTSIRKRTSAQGNAMLQGLAEDAQSVLPSSIPDSGTAGRSMLGILAGGGAGGALLGNPWAGAGLAAGAIAPYTQMGGKAAEWLLTGRQGPASKAVSNAFRKLIPATSRAATAAAVPQNKNAMNGR